MRGPPGRVTLRGVWKGSTETPCFGQKAPSPQSCPLRRPDEKMSTPVREGDSGLRLEEKMAMGRSVSPRSPEGRKFSSASLHRKAYSIPASCPKVSPANLSSITALLFYSSARSLLTTRMHLPELISSLPVSALSSRQNAGGCGRE